MKSHLFIAFGLLIAAIFFMRGMEALNEPGLGLREVYILGGFLVAGLLVRAGWKERKPPCQCDHCRSGHPTETFSINKKALSNP